MDYSDLQKIFEEEVIGVKAQFLIPVKIAIVGFGKSGKSTLFNALFGKDLQEIGAQTDLTIKEHSAKLFGAIFTDTRGFGTKKVKIDEIIPVIEEQNLVIHCLNGMSAISEEDVELHQFISRRGRPYITVVTKTDVMKKREIEEYASSVEEKLNLSSIDLLFISAETGLNMRELVSRILDLLPEAVKDAFIAKQGIDFDLKKKKAKRIVKGAATACAGIAITPIPVADITIMTPVQIGMVLKIAALFGMELSWKRAKELLATVGSGLALRSLAQTLLKFFPIAGSFISPAIAFSGTMALGEVAIFYFENQMALDKQQIEERYYKAIQEAKRVFEVEKLEGFE